MDKSQRKQLYRRLLNDSFVFHCLLHPEDVPNEYWNKIMQEKPENMQAVNELKTIIKGMKVVDEGLTPEAKNELWRRIEKSLSPERKTGRLPRFLRYAAIFAFVATLSVYLYTTQKNPSDKPIDYQSFISDTATAGAHSGNIVIVLDNNKKIEINESNAELIHDTEGNIRVNAEVIKRKESGDKQEKNLNQLYVPYGKTTNLVLSDGSKIWVNSGSHLIYPTVFADNKHEIYIDGEAYLEVARNEQSPFIVKTDRLEIQALGTAFNISAYKNEKQQSVVLAVGSVSVRGNNEKTVKTIRPNQKYTFEKNTNTSDIQEVDVFDYICWKYGFLTFKNEKLSAVLNRVERYYNVHIDYDPSTIDHTSVSGKLDLKEDMKETFRIISITAPIEYTIRDNEVKINVKP